MFSFRKNNSHLLTMPEILDQFYLEIYEGHRSAIFSNSRLSRQMRKQLRKLNLHVITDKDLNKQPRVIIYWQ